MTEKVTFTEEHQSAIVGHSLRDKRKFDYLVEDMGVTKEWLFSNALKEIWPHIVGFCNEYNKPAATIEELKGYVEAKEGDSRYTDKFIERIKNCIKDSKRFSWDVLEQKLLYWSKDQVIKGHVEKVAELFNSGEKDRAYQLYDEGAIKLNKLNLSTTDGDKMVPSALRAEKAMKEADKRKGSYLEFGITWLNDCLGGIGKSDLVLLGGYTGSGKTEAAKIIAEHNAKNGARVGVFALEADENEWENRIMFSYCARKFREDNYGNTLKKGHINYLDWIMRRLPCLEKYEADAVRYVQKELKNLKTYYRTSSDFSTRTLEREFLRHHKEFDLLVLDHIHYVDMEGGKENSENQEQHKLVKTMRSLTIGTGVPMLAIGHLRKKMGGASAKIVPDIDDFHGSSNIGKIATAAALMARHRGAQPLDEGTTDNATLMRFGKFRRDGNRTNCVGMTFFDNYTNNYIDGYAVGKLNVSETEWTCLPDPSKAPHWAKNAKFWDFQESA